MRDLSAGRIGIYLISLGLAVLVFSLIYQSNDLSKLVFPCALLMSSCSVLLGVFLLILHSRIIELQWKKEAPGKSWLSSGEATKGSFRGHGFRRKEREQAKAPPIPAFGLVFALAASAIFLPSWWMFNGLNPAEGFWVQTRISRFSVPVSAEWPKALVLRIDRKSHWYLNEQPVSMEELSRRLTQEFSLRANWVVYLEADERLPFFEPAKAIDLIQELHGKTILLTPKLRTEFARSVERK